MPGTSGLFTPEFKRQARSIGSALGWHGSPRFLIVGAEKAGTTALFRYLSRHARLVSSVTKETYFFSPEAFRGWTHNPEYPFYDRLKNEAFDPMPRRWALRWYHAQFPVPRPGRFGLNFEATPGYFYYPLTPRRIHAYRPQMKLIVLLRDPVERAFSAWNMFHGIRDPKHMQLAERRGFDEAVREELDQLGRVPLAIGTDYVRRGLYYAQLRRYLEYFPGRQIHVVHSRDLRLRTPEALRGICEFLGVEPLEGDDWPPVLAGEYDSEMPAETRELLTRFYAPHNESLFTLLGRTFGWQK
jgi:hypothetical protein